MNEIAIEQPTIKRRKRRAVAKPPKVDNPCAGITAIDCPRACTKDRCVISTVAVCKHPCKSPVSGCGPLTIKNREAALRLIKHQKVDADRL
jgi:hypothetical protein